MIKEIISFRNKKSIVDMQQFSNDWTMQIFAESSVGESLPITSEFELLLVNELGTYLIPSDYYDIQNGTIILWGNAEITQFSGLNELYLKHDCFVSYGAKMCVIDKAEECSEVDLLPEYECGGDIDLTEYRKSVDQDVIDNGLQNQINGINANKADKTELVVINEHISENAEAIIGVDGRLTNLENQFTLLPDFEQFLTTEEDPIFNEWLSTFDFNQFVSKEASLLDDFKNLSLEPGYYYTNEDTLNDTPDGNISNAELIVSPNLRTWIGVDKWNGVFIRSYIVDTNSWNPWRQLLSTKDIEYLENRVTNLENDYSLSTAIGGAVASVPTIPTDISFTTSDLTKNNNGIEIISPTQFSVLKSGIWEAQIKTNAMKIGSGTNGTYLLGIALNGAVSKGAWQQVQVSESGSVDDASAVNRFIGYLEVGNIVSFQHYDSGEGGITLIDTTTNHPVFVTLNLLKGEK